MSFFSVFQLRREYTHIIQLDEPPTKAIGATTTPLTKVSFLQTLFHSHSIHKYELSMYNIAVDLQCYIQKI